MPDPDLEIREWGWGGGVGRCLKNFFGALVWSKNKGGGAGTPLPSYSPGDSTTKNHLLIVDDHKNMRMGQETLKRRVCSLCSWRDRQTAYWQRSCEAPWRMGKRFCLGARFLRLRCQNSHARGQTIPPPIQANVCVKACWNPCTGMLYVIYTSVSTGNRNWHELLRTV